MRINAVGPFKAAALIILYCASALTQTDSSADQAKLQKHAELFPNYRGSPRLEDLKPNEDGIIRPQRNPIVDYLLLSTPPTGAQKLKQTTEKADAVISGTTETRYSAINPGHTFLYSDWIIKVTRVYKNTSAVPVNYKLTVTRMGGDLIVNGQRIIDSDSFFPEFALRHEYVFFLKALPETTSFLTRSGETFDVTGANPVLLADRRNPTALRKFSSGSTADFLAAVENSTME